MSVHRCPICLGKGKMPEAFYEGDGTGSRWTATAPRPMVDCRSCYGRGIIEQFEPAISIPSVWPAVPYIQPKTTTTTNVPPDSDWYIIYC